MSATEWMGASQVTRSWPAQDRPRLVGERRVLDPGLGKRLHDTPVEVRVGQLSCTTVPT